LKPGTSRRTPQSETAKLASDIDRIRSCDFDLIRAHITSMPQVRRVVSLIQDRNGHPAGHGYQVDGVTLPRLAGRHLFAGI
jgi:hypothetical protein